MNSKKITVFCILTVSLVTIGFSSLNAQSVNAEDDGNLNIKNLGENIIQNNDCHDKTTDCQNLFDDGDGFDVWNLGFADLKFSFEREIAQVNQCSDGASCGNMIQSEFAIANGPLDIEG